MRIHVTLNRLQTAELEADMAETGCGAAETVRAWVITYLANRNPRPTAAHAPTPTVVPTTAVENKRPVGRPRKYAVRTLLTNGGYDPRLPDDN
jgi:hypothetical protein